MGSIISIELYFSPIEESAISGFCTKDITRRKLSFCHLHHRVSLEVRSLPKSIASEGEEKFE
eukprot:UN23883